MKICLVSDQLADFHKTWSGAELVLKQAADFLKKEKQEVIFITTEFSRENNPREILQIPTINIKTKFLRAVGAPLFRLLGIVSSFRYLKKEKPDIVHFFHSNYLSIPVMISAYILGIPTVFTVLDYFIICPRNNLRLDNGKTCDKKEGLRCLKCVSKFKFFEKLIIRIFSKNLKGIITFTETSRARLIKHGIPEYKIKVIYAYNPPSVAAGRGKEIEVIADSILFVGTFFEYKGLHVIIQALSEVPNSKLMIVGTGNEQDKARIERMVGDLGLRDRINFLGQKKNEEVLELISKSEVVVVPEQWPSDFGPLILVEAMALGKPLVASNIGGIPEFIKDGISGFLAEYDKPEQFAEKIIWLLKNKLLARAMGEQAQRNVRLLLNNNQGRKTLELYNYAKIHGTAN
jgi:glycosyltransferase involved in cell wall biosynthesis